MQVPGRAGSRTQSPNQKHQRVKQLHRCDRTQSMTFFAPTNAPSRSHAGTIVGFCPPSTLTTTEVKAPNGKTHEVQSPDKPITHILVKINTPSSFTLHGLPECVYPVPLKSYTSHVRGHDGKLSISQFPIRYFTPRITFCASRTSLIQHPNLTRPSISDPSTPAPHTKSKDAHSNLF